jgi:hypothetical protein
MSLSGTKRPASEVFDDADDESARAAKMSPGQRTHVFQLDKLDQLFGPGSAKRCVEQLADSFQRVQASLRGGNSEYVAVLSVIEEGSPHDPLFGTVWSVQVTAEDTPAWLAAGALLSIAYAYAAGGMRTGTPVHAAILRPWQPRVGATAAQREERAHRTIEMTGARTLDCAHEKMDHDDSVEALCDMLRATQGNRDVHFEFGTRGLASIGDADRVLFQLIATETN